jgi:spore maturation protein CgeB
VEPWRIRRKVVTPPLKLVIFGLSISSSWGNGHATLWRGLCRALGKLGHRVVFFEKDVPYYASQRDRIDIPGCELRLYSDWNNVIGHARRELSDADVAMVTSYCPDGIDASRLTLDSPAQVRCFYDLDTPVTISRLLAGEPVDYLLPEGLGDFDLVLSYTGGAALDYLRSSLKARRVAPLYGSVDPEVHQPAPGVGEFRADLSYLGTYAEDRQQVLERFFIDPARLSPERKFAIGGAQYPADFPWTNNIFFLRHLPPNQHPAFYGSSRMTLNVTRRAMADMGYCPSGRLFEAAACRVPILSDEWEGLDQFYTPGKEILVCRSTRDVLDALQLPDDELARIATAARNRTLVEHTAERRAIDFELILEDTNVGHHSGSGEGQPHPAARLLQRTLAGREPV